MAVSTSRDGLRLQFTAAGDEVTFPLQVRQIIWEGESGSVFGTDTLEISDPDDNTDILYKRLSGGPYHDMRSGEFNKPGMRYANGIRIETLTGDRGTVYVDLW